MSGPRSLAARLALLLASPVFVSDALAVTVYTNRADWQAAVAVSVTTETFSTDQANAMLLSFPTGLSSTGFGGDDTNGVGVMVPQTYTGRVDTDSDYGEADVFERIEWTFPQPIFAFGADFTDVASGEGLQLSGDFDGTGDVTFDFLAELGPGATGFFGVVGLGPFTSITFTSRTGDPAVPGLPTSGLERFEVDDASWAVVPEPGTSTLLLLGLAGIGHRQRKRIEKELSSGCTTRV